MSNEKRKTIGRQLNTQALMVEMTDTQRSQVFTLKTGRKISTCSDQGVPEIYYPDD